MKVISVLLCVLVIQSAAKGGVDPKLILTEIDDNHVGKTFLNAIQIGLATGSPIHEI